MASAKLHSTTLQEAEGKVTAAEFDASEAVKSLATAKDLAAKVWENSWWC